MTTQVTEERLSPWEGVGSPGIGGYVLADVAAVAALAVLLPSVDATVADLGDYLAGVALVGFYAFFYSIPLALVGIPIVHFCCLRVRNQAVHVLAAGLVGTAMITLPVLVLSGELSGAGLYLGAATAIGRAAVIPLALARRQP
jgi:hypothetical protein